MTETELENLASDALQQVRQVSLVDEQYEYGHYDGFQAGFKKALELVRDALHDKYLSGSGNDLFKLMLFVNEKS